VSEIITLVVSAADSGVRADVLLSCHLAGLSRSAVQALFRDGLIEINGVAGRPSHRAAVGDVIAVTLEPRASLSAAPELIPIVVVYQDTDLAVIDKPAGLVVHPAPGHEHGTLANALAAHFPQLTRSGSELRPGIVHRLDKNTSGLMVVALSAPALADLQAQIRSRSVSREYRALVSGRLAPRTGSVEAPIGRDRTDRKRMAVHGVAARGARTSYRVLEYVGGFSYLAATLHTGRTHQIRVHLAAIGHPIVGDATYGGPQYPGLERHFLHACRLAVTSPSSGKRLEFTSCLSADLERVIHELRRKLHS
jgi:23S rRNA pseudouridine1911/1915/1917 synthase